MRNLTRGHRLKSRNALCGGIFPSCPVTDKIPAGAAQRDFPCPHESSCTSCNLLGQKALAGFLRTSQVSRRSTYSARTAWEFAKLPFRSRETALLAAGRKRGHRSLGPKRAKRKFFVHLFSKRWRGVERSSTALHSVSEAQENRKTVQWTVFPGGTLVGGSLNWTEGPERFL